MRYSLINTANRYKNSSERFWPQKPFFDVFPCISIVLMRTGTTLFLPLIFVLMLQVPVGATEDDKSILLTIPVILSTINAQNNNNTPPEEIEVSPPNPVDSTDCSYRFENEIYLKLCDTKRSDGSLIYAEQIDFRAFDGGQGIFHHYQNSNRDYLNYNKFYYQTDSRVDTSLQSLDWVVEVVRFEGLEGSTISCNAHTTASPSPPGKVVVMAEWKNNQGTALKEWPLVTCDDAPAYSECNNTIKTLGYMDECQQEALNQQPYDVLRSFPGNCNEVWDHNDEEGGLQECQLL